MTDRELLEAAARAGGIVGEYESWCMAYGGFNEGIRQVLNGKKCQRPWNPLTDDGDALRLAVERRIDVLHRVVDGERVEAIAPGGAAIIERCNAQDRPAATRRAITRAAAAIGARKEDGG